MSAPAIQINDLGKRYRYGGVAALNTSLRADITDWVKGMFRKTEDRRPGTEVNGQRSPVSGPLSSSASRHPTFHEIHERHVAADPNYFWALKDINLEIQQGEVVGIIGRNGAGKSTLLKILSRITPPTTGRVTYHGRIASLLEVGTGFHRELTGRENIFLNGSILGMKRAEIARKFDEIVAFAEVEKFIDTPVKFYSSGMYVRLAFAVAAHLEPEILVVDEVLAVGDASFQKKCLGKMGDVARQGRTVLFVSHNMGAVLRLCSRCLWIDGGRIIMDGPASEVVAAYNKQGLSNQSERQWTEGDRPGNDTMKLCAARVCQPAGVRTASVDITQSFDIEIETETFRELKDAGVALRVLTEDGQTVLHTANVFGGLNCTWSIGRRVWVCRLPAYTLNAGTYVLAVAGDIPNIRILFAEENVLSWRVEAVSPQMGKYGPGAWTGFIGPGLASWFSKEAQNLPP